MAFIPILHKTNDPTPHSSNTMQLLWLCKLRHKLFADSIGTPSEECVQVFPIPPNLLLWGIRIDERRPVERSKEEIPIEKSYAQSMGTKPF